MATFTFPISASFGAARSGLAASVGYKVVSADGTSRIARTSSGVTERVDAAGNATTGVYVASPALDTAWGFVRVVWDVTGQTGVAAEETVNTGAAFLDASVASVKAKTDGLPAAPAAVGSAMTLDLTQAVPLSNTAHSVGDAMNAARAQGFGKWALSGTTLTLYAANGTTVVRQFTLDSASAPTQRA